MGLAQRALLRAPRRPQVQQNQSITITLATQRSSTLLQMIHEEVLECKVDWLREHAPMQQVRQLGCVNKSTRNARLCSLLFMIPMTLMRDETNHCVVVMATQTMQGRQSHLSMRWPHAQSLMRVLMPT
jgi:hypothetical protein